MVIDLIDEACTAGARQSRACEVIEIDERTLRRWREQLKTEHRLEDRRREAAARQVPANKLSAQEKAKILEVCSRPEFRSLPPSQIVPILADRGEYYGSEATFYRVLREADQQHERGRARSPRQVPRPQGYKATRPRQTWSWDITYLAASIRGTFYRLYLIEDIYSRAIVGWEVHEEESAEHASELIRKACLREGIHQKGLVLHSDNGSPMKGATMLSTLQRLGVVPSFSRPSVSDDNPYSESLFRTLKYTPTFPSTPFASLAEAREWVHTFVQWYNEQHRHSAIGFVTPGQRHRGEDVEILARRQRLYEAAKAERPEGTLHEDIGEARVEFERRGKQSGPAGHDPVHVTIEETRSR
jgi:putative transposase